MDKTDVMYGIAAVIIILLMAIVVKPMLTGQPVNTGIPKPVTTIPAETNMTPTTPSPATITTTKIPTTIPTTVVQTTPTWNNKVQTVGFVNSSTYGVSLTAAIPNGTRINSSVLNTTMVSFAKITGKSSGTTQVINIPFPYWELVYTVDPVAQSKTTSLTVTPTRGGNAVGGGIQGSYSDIMPDFTIQVMDAQDPNRVVRTITPPGGIDLNLWTGVKTTLAPGITPRKGQLLTNPTDVPIVDPRPWTEKFFEGQRSYYFIITEHLLNSYSIDIRVPTRYTNTT